MKKYFCGVDGGATKTLCVVADENGYILGVGEAGPSSMSLVGLKGVEKAVKNAVNSSIRSAGLPSRDVDVLFLAIAGAGSECRREAVRRSVEEANIADVVFVDSDAIAALTAATLGKPGIVAISGTGSIVLGVNGRGEVHRACGWGYLVDDEGSAFYIGREALRRSLMALDGRGPPTVLGELISRHFGAESLSQVIDLISLGEVGVVEIAGLAPLVLEAYKLGDGVAVDIVHQACRELALATLAVARRIELEGEVLVGVCGGVFEGSEIFVKLFSLKLRELMPSAKVVKPLVKPVIGALLLAYRSVGRELSEELVNRVLDSAANYSKLVVAREV